MANNITEAVEICRNLEFELKLKIVMAFIAKEILAEEPSVPFHLTRARWANRALNRPTDEVKKVCLVMSITPFISLDSEDIPIIQAVRDNVNTFAGAFAELPIPVDGIRTNVVIEETDHDNNVATAPVVTKRTFMNFFKRTK